MKRILSLILTITILASLVVTLPITVSAENDGDYYYNVIDGGAVITAYLGEDASITIPETLGGYPVTRIGDDALANSLLEEVIIPDGVISIDNNAFYNSIRLTRVSIPDSVTTIGESAFAWCKSLEEIEIPQSVTYIGTCAFLGCERLARVFLDANITTISDFAFSNCERLESIVIPEGVTSVGYQAFFYCPSLKTITIPKSVGYIGYEAFLECDRFADVIYTGMIKDWEYIFIEEGNNALLYSKIICEDGEITPPSPDGGEIPDDDRVPEQGEIGTPVPDEDVIYDTDEDFEYEIIDGKATIIWCHSNKANLVIPSNFNGHPVTEIDSFVFGECDNLKTVKIPQSIEKLHEETFAWCGNLEAIEVAPENANYSSADGILFNKDKTELIAYPSQKATKSVEIPDGVETVSDFAFINKEHIEYISIPASLKRFDGDFSTCYILKSIEVDPANKKFSSVDGILFNKDKTEIISYPAEKKGTSYVIPDGVEALHKAVFMNTRYLTSVTIPKSVKFISSEALAYGGNLENIVVEPGNEKYSAADGVLFNKDKTELISCPSAKSATNYKTPSGVKVIGDGAFANCYKLESITVSSGVEEIGESAFAYSDFVEKITLPSTVKSIGSVAFEGCISLKEIVIPDGITEIKWATFTNCEGLEKITIPQSVTTIDFGAFDGCERLKTVYYGGTEKEWKDIVIEDDNDALLSAKKVYGHKENIGGGDSEDKPEEKPEIKPITSLKFAKSSMTLYAENDFDLSEILTVKPTDNTDAIIWTSSDEDVATVDEDGVVTLHKSGKATITATAEESGKKATCKITVMRAPEAIEITGTGALAQGKTVTLKATAYYEEDGKVVKTKDAISWRSEDTSVATVSKGKVKGVGAGTTKIIAYIEGTDIEEEFEITVAVPVKTLKFASTKATVYVGNSFDLGAKMTVAPIENTDEIIWTSSDEYIVTVSEDGVVTPHMTGSATITATALAGNKKATCKITVTREPEGIEITGTGALAQGKTATLKAYSYYVENAKVVKTKDEISWRSEDTSVVTVSKGKVKGVGAGTTKIYAYIEGTDIEEEFEITVAVPVKTLKFASTKATVYVGNSFDLGAKMTVAPIENTDEIEWTSSNTNIATVNEKGVVTPIKTGSVTITAKALAGNKKVTCKITVTHEPTGIELTGDSAIAKGKTVTLKAYSYYVENAKVVKTKDEISWRSEDTSVATVSKGKVKGIKAGKTTIVAYVEGTDVQKKFEVSVVVPVKSIKLDIKKLEVGTNTTINLNDYITISPLDSTDALDWTSSNEKVATVQDGVVKTKARGETKITAKAVAGKKTATVTITVK